MANPQTIRKGKLNRGFVIKIVVYSTQDLRRRKIWDFFEKSGTDLRVQTFVPKPEALVSDYDWVIGNHSDELTPWYSTFSLRNKISEQVLYRNLSKCFFSYYINQDSAHLFIIPIQILPSSMLFVRLLW
jgi:hypothetical protein